MVPCRAEEMGGTLEYQGGRRPVTGQTPQSDQENAMFIALLD